MEMSRPGSPVKAIAPTAALADQAFHAIRDAITSGRLAAGQAVTERSLAEFLNVSPTPVREAKSLRAQPDGKVLVTDGPYLETKEHIGGFWVLEAANLEDALAWGRKAVVACRAPVEVRAFGIPP